MTQKFDNFMVELKALCEKHEVEIINSPINRERVLVFDLGWGKTLNPEQFEDCTNK